MVSSYDKGRRFEYRVRDELIKEGWIVERSMLSRGPWDLKARKPGIVRLIQCKKRRYASLSKEEKEGLAKALEEIRASGLQARAEMAKIGSDQNDARRVPIIYKEVDL